MRGSTVSLEVSYGQPIVCESPYRKGVWRGSGHEILSNRTGFVSGHSPHTHTYGRLSQPSIRSYSSSSAVPIRPIGGVRCCDVASLPRRSTGLLMWSSRPRSGVVLIRTHALGNDLAAVTVGTSYSALATAFSTRAPRRTTFTVIGRHLATSIANPTTDLSKMNIEAISMIVPQHRAEVCV